MQRGYVYRLIEPAGQGFDPRFRPELTPKEMLALGVFGGKYLTDCRNELPADWYENAILSPARRDPSLNFFGVDASKPLSYWRAKGWIDEDDPRGWFQRYCRSHLGRRDEDDERQINRWRDALARRPTAQGLRARGPRLPTAAAPGPPPLGVRQSPDPASFDPPC